MRKYLKAIAPALMTLIAVAIQWAVTGEYDRAELVTTLTGLSAATITFLVRNEELGPFDLEPGRPAAEPDVPLSG